MEQQRRLPEVTAVLTCYCRRGGRANVACAEWIMSYPCFQNGSELAAAVDDYVAGGSVATTTYGPVIGDWWYVPGTLGIVLVTLELSRRYLF